VDAKSSVSKCLTFELLAITNTKITTRTADMSGAEEQPKPVLLQDYDEEDEEQNPGAFMWIEGDSLAPPCQSDRDVVDKIVEIAQLSPDDVRLLFTESFSRPASLATN